MEKKTSPKIYKSSILDLDEKGIVTVAANAFGNEDSDGDISEYGSFSKTLKEHFLRVKWFLNHNKTQLLGVPIEGSETQKYLQMRGQINMNKQIGRDTYEDYRLYAEHGRTLEHSIGVEAVKRDATDKRIVKEWKLWEYSTLTHWGANHDTPLLGIKSDESPEEALAFLEMCVRKGNYTDMRGKEIEENIALLKALITNEPSADTQEHNEPLPSTYQFLTQNFQL